MNISDEQIKKIFELASMEDKLKQSNISENDISQALITIERKLDSFSDEIKTDLAENKKVLIADDLELSIYQLSTLLKRIGINPSIARNKEEALSEIQKMHFDCIILDLFIPDSSDGIDLINAAVKRKQALGTNTSIVSISSTDDSSLVEKCYQCGADFYIQKDKDWHAKLLKYLSSIFQTDESAAFVKYILNSNIASYSIRKLHESKVFDELKQSVNLSLYSGLKNILFDLNEISKFDVENAYIFADMYKICADNGGKLVLLNPSSSIKEALEFAYLTDVIPFVYSVAEAVEAFSA